MGNCWDFARLDLPVAFYRLGGRSCLIVRRRPLKRIFEALPQRPGEQRALFGGEAQRLRYDLIDAHARTLHEIDSEESPHLGAAWAAALRFVPSCRRESVRFGG